MNEHFSYLFSDIALTLMRHFIDRSTLFAFDLDGTLAPIAKRPSGIGIPNTIKNELSLLNEQATVAVITGRSRTDALSYLNFSPTYVVGNHGAEGLPEWKKKEKAFARTARHWQRQLDLLLPIETRNGIVIENKGTTLSIHYRQAQHARESHLLIISAINCLIPKPRRIGGKYIENLMPQDAPDKGIALIALMKRAGCVKGFFVGDDITDEDVFRIRNENLFTVRVGRSPKSQARFYLRSQSEISRLLQTINNSLKKSQKKIPAPIRLLSGQNKLS